MTIDEFRRRTADMPYLAKGIFWSELYLLADLCDRHGVTHVIESGVRNGMSTRVLWALWGKGRVTSVELHTGRIPADLLKHVISGDGREVIPPLLARSAPNSVAVLLDGPKGGKADAFRDACFAFPSVKIVAQHDTARGRGETAHSWDKEFRESAEMLDADIPEPYRAKCFRDPSRVPGLGIWVRP